MLSGRDLCSFTANASGHSTTTVVDDDVKSSISQNMRFQDAYLFIPAASLTADKVRQVASFAASTGTYTVDRVYSASTIPNAALYEIHPYIEPLTDLTLMINDALKRCLVVEQFNFAPTADSYEQDLTAQASWLTDRSWARAVYLQGTDGEQQQTLTESGSPTGGTFTVSYRGNTTSTIAFDATAATVQTALRALHSDLAAVTVTRTGTTTNFVWVATMVGVPTYQPVMTDTSTSLTGGSSPDVAITITRDRTNLARVVGHTEQRMGRVYLCTPGQQFETTDRLYVKAIKRAYDACRTSATGAFGDRAGLAAEAHEAPVPVEWVGYGTLVIAANRSINNLTGNMRDSVAQNAQRWLSMYGELTRKNFSLQRDAKLELIELPSFGPAAGGRWSW